MATSFRYGHGGSYKSACAVWFDLLPALREGRVCITNIHGMQPLEVIEKRLGEKFPDSARLVRISSRNPEGFELWKYFFCWAPIGSFILIDECQQIYSTNAGFKMATVHKRPFSDFEPHLPQGFSEIFHSRWLTVDRTTLDEGEVDDCQRTRFDEQGRIIYPENFNNAFMEHRHYNWDIVLLTPDFAQIPKELKGVAELAKQHKGKDGIFFSNRKPRILEHDPLRTVTVPSKDDVVYNLKVPLDVHLLYASTVTGQITKSGLGKNVFLNPKFLAAMAIFILSMGYLTYAIIGIFSGSETSSETASDINQTSQQSDVSSSSRKTRPGQNSKTGDVVDSGSSDCSGTGCDSGVYHDVGLVPAWFPLANSETIYVSSVERWYKRKVIYLNVHFEISTSKGVSYFDDVLLKKMGVEMDFIDDCLVRLSDGESYFFVTCSPYEQYAQTSEPSDIELKPVGGLFGGDDS
ncbi:zonular occludens toxin domain-containing protein [Vibrio harveyi]|uniref:zonular occludens toxin domain-containing protein n=1 Tax=Vibrio harveyi TaxID=669 RepID=UPI00234DDC12|nr:zonular occludens toxin domain-containing protein [Vibrio harveyi]WCP83980.1 zonular occludens toxin domain-containing protein [Vibrio harveyi]WCP83989.1 zonular occludens toxin domain-containing protein [Vibrio harveyi]